MQYSGLSITKLFLCRIRTLLGVLRYYLKYQILNRKILIKTKKLKNSCKDKKVFVFGNGPSMNKLDPFKIKKYQEQGYDIIAVNSFAHSKMWDAFKPNYAVFSDPLDFIEVGENHPRAQRAKTGKIDKEKIMQEDITIFAPITFCKINNYNSTFYFCDAENVFSKNVSNILKPRGYKSWTGMKALAIACYLGYSEIYICGMDYNTFKNITVNKNNEAVVEIEHFYEDSNRPNYIESQSKRNKKKSRTLGEFLYLASFNFKMHEKFDKFPIINLDPFGLIDAFSKKHNLDIYKNN